MEARRWSVRLSAAVLLTLQGLAVAQGPSCGSRQYPSNGRCCNRCPPGRKVAAACSEGSNTTCSPCEEHHFQAGWTKETHCTAHHPCNLKAGLTFYQNATNMQDFVCRCQEGTHCSSPECDTCRPHASCRPGEGVQREGNHRNDTLCAPCSLGYFSNVTSATAPCQPWSRCPEGQLQVKGTQAIDAVCENPPETPEARKSPLLVLLPIAAFLLGGLLFLWYRRGKCRRKQHQDLPPEPTENEEDCPTFPTQETLLGQQAGLPEKDCRLAQQEQV